MIYLKEQASYKVPDSTPTVAAVITVYNPVVKAFLENFSALKESNVKTIVVNDGSQFDSASRLEFVDAVNKLSFVLIDHESNLGIASALNSGIRNALGLGADYVLLLDQDSPVSASLVKELLAAHEWLKNTGRKIAAIGPTHVDIKAGIVSDFFCVDANDTSDEFTVKQFHFSRCDFLITSGCLIHRSVLESVGLMDESLFIDAVDFEWFFRARSRGFQAYGVKNLVLGHSLGESSHAYWFKKWRHISKHSPFRYYYIYRNSILLWRRPYVPAGWKKNDFKRLYKTAIIFAIFVPGRINNLKMMIRGIIDGIRGKSGKIPRVSP